MEEIVNKIKIILIFSFLFKIFFPWFFRWTSKYNSELKRYKWWVKASKYTTWSFISDFFVLTLIYFIFLVQKNDTDFNDTTSTFLRKKAIIYNVHISYSIVITLLFKVALWPNTRKLKKSFDLYINKINEKSLKNINAI